jgi:hypothetical protein
VCPKPVNVRMCADRREASRKVNVGVQGHSYAESYAESFLGASWVLPWRLCSSSDSPATLLQRSC